MYKKCLQTALLGLVCLAGPGVWAQSSVAPQAALDEMNAEYQYVWDRLRPALQTTLLQQARTELGALHHQSGPLEVFTKHVHGVSVDATRGPGFHHLATNKLRLRAPSQGGWTLEAEAEIRVKLRLGFFRPTIDVPVKVRVEDLSVAVEAFIDDSDPTRPQAQRVGKPDTRFRVKLRSRRWYYDLLFRLLSPIGERLAKKFLNDALTQMMPQLQSIQGLPGPVPGAGTPLLTDSGTPTPFRTIVANVDRKIRAHHVPHGTLLEIVLDTPALDSYEVAYGPGGPGIQGNLVRYWDGGDSAIWTGHYLASQALRYHTTAEPAALDNVRHAVGGIGKLLDVNGNGLLARVAAPENTLMGAEILRHGTYGRKTLNGQTWVWRQGGNGISRDQYSGVFFGLMLVYDLVNDPALQAEAARRIQQMLDYIIARRWFVDEDRRAFNGTANSGFPTFWAGVASQRLTWLLMGNRVANNRYAADLRQAGPLAATNWLAAWISTFNLDSYYKFNLSHSTNYNYYRLETNQQRWADMARSKRILIRYVGHHHNPHFDLVHASFDPSLRATKHPGVREALRKFVKRNHREVGPAVVDLSNVQWVTITLPSVALPGQTPKPQQRTLPSQPIDIVLRKPEGNFLWQRTPFSPARPHGGMPTKETPGIDLVLPYWMGRHEGAF